jgi:NADH-ubiquinone oxidoreductase chain 5
LYRCNVVKWDVYVGFTVFAFFISICSASLVTTYNLYMLFTVDISLFYLFDFHWFTCFVNIACICLCGLGFSYYYMFDDSRYREFLCCIYVFSLLILDTIVCFDGLAYYFYWEGIGFISYILVSWFLHRVAAVKAAWLGILINRLTDVLICLGFCSLFVVYLSNCLLIWSKVYLLFSFIILSTTTKSALWMFHIWLPFAMEGPTPVSSLIHSSTLVILGIVVIIKFSICIQYMFNAILIQLLTIINYSLLSLLNYCQLDIKRLIAYSTISQLSLIYIIYSLNYSLLALYYILIHACFKSILFMLVGVVLHSCFNSQDTRHFTSILYVSKFISIYLFIVLFNSYGWLLTDGYWKEWILEFMGISCSLVNEFNCIIIFSFMILSMQYMYLLILLCSFTSRWLVWNVYVQVPIYFILNIVYINTTWMSFVNKYWNIYYDSAIGVWFIQSLYVSYIVFLLSLIYWAVLVFYINVTWNLLNQHHIDNILIYGYMLFYDLYYTDLSRYLFIYTHYIYCYYLLIQVSFQRINHFYLIYVYLLLY